MFWRYLGFWIDQGSEYASGSGYTGVLNMARLCRVLDMPKYVWIVYEYVGIYMNMPKFAWITFALRFPILTPCLHGCVVTYFNFYMKLEVIVWRNKRLFWKRVNLFFFIIAEVFDLFLFFFCFRLNIFLSKVSNLLLSFGAREVEGQDSDTWRTATEIVYFSN